MAEIAVNVTLFTLVEEDRIRSLLGSGLLLSDSPINADASGMCLWVVTTASKSTTSDILAGGAARQLPETQVLPGERLMDAARRLVWSELGMTTKAPLREIKFFDDPARDPSGNTIAVAFWAIANFDDVLRYLGGKDQVGLELVNSAAFLGKFAPSTGDSLDTADGVSRFGFRVQPDQKRGHWRYGSIEATGKKHLVKDHDEIVFYGWRKLRAAFTGRLDPFRYLGLNPLGDRFTFGQLQEFADLARGVLSDKNDVDTYRRKFMQGNTVTELEETAPSKGRGKPSRYLELNDWVSDSLGG